MPIEVVQDQIITISSGPNRLFGATTGTDNVAVGYKAITVGTGISFATSVGTSAIDNII